MASPIRPTEAERLRAATVPAAQQTAPSFGDILNYTLFHKSATVLPSQAPGQSKTGVVTGNLNAISPNGAAIAYALAQQPANGSVALSQNGSYTYTPDLNTALSGGTDTFSVSIDNGSAYRLTGIGGAIQSALSALAQLIGLRQPDTITVGVPVSVASTIVTIPVGSRLYGVVVSPDGQLIYTANYDEAVVSVIDSTTATVAKNFAVREATACRNDLCEGPINLALSADGTRLYASGGTTPLQNPDGSLGRQSGPPLTVIDTESGAVVDQYDIGGSEADLALSRDGQSIYIGVNGWGGGQPTGIKVLDLVTSETTYFGNLSLVVTPSTDGKTIYLVDYFDYSVLAYDADTNTQLWSTPILLSNRKYTAFGIATNGERVYVSVVSPIRSDGVRHGVAVLDAATGNLITIIQTDPGSDPSWYGIAVSPDGKRVYTANHQAGTLSVIDAISNNLIATADIGGNPWAVAVSPDGGSVYVTNRTAGTLSLIPV